MQEAELEQHLLGIASNPLCQGRTKGAACLALAMLRRRTGDDDGARVCVCVFSFERNSFIFILA